MSQKKRKIQAVETSFTRPLQLVLRSKGEKNWQINPKAVELLQGIEGKVAVITIIGAFRTGKSYVLNRLAGLTGGGGFALGSEVVGCTRGIWIWGEPVKMGDLKVLLLDVEGLYDPLRNDPESAQDDQNLFSLSILLSSMFIFNTRGTIDSTALNHLQLVLQLTKNIRFGADQKTQPNSTQIAEQMPSLLWLVRDATLQLSSGMKDDNDYLEKNLEDEEGNAYTAQTNESLIKNCKRCFFPNVAVYGCQRQRLRKIGISLELMKKSWYLNLKKK